MNELRECPFCDGKSRTLPFGSEHTKFPVMRLRTLPEPEVIIDDFYGNHSLAKVNFCQMCGRPLSADAIRRADGWVPCAERLPTEADADKNGDVQAIDSDGVQWVEIWMYTKEPEYTHWRKLPTPPEG